MAYDYVQHAITDRWEGRVVFEGEDFAMRLGRAMGGRLMGVMLCAVVGLMFVVPGVGFVRDGGPQVPMALGMVLFGAALLFNAARLALARRTLRSRGDALRLRGGAPFASETEVAPLREVVDAQPQIAPHSFIEKVTTTSRPTSDAYRPFTVAVILADTRRVLPLRMRPEHARRLAADLLEALEERKRRIAARAGYRG